jgi:hypothetical protein
MRRVVLQVAVATVGLFTLSAFAEVATPRTEIRKGLVSILTDGITEPNGRATQAINELADYGRRIDNVRVLPISGHGAVANVRDLLYLRGVDLAVLNGDILAFLDQTGQYPDARRRIRYVTHLFDQKVFLLVRKDINAIEDLRRRKLVVLSEFGAGRVTAGALFGLSKIDVAVEAIGAGEVLDDSSLSKFDGALLLGDELTRVRFGAQMRREYHLLPIVMTLELQKTYRGAEIEAQELAGFANSANSANVATVAVSTLLAVFDWAPSQGRYADVTNFIAALLSNFRGLRQQSSNSIWRQADIAAQSPGWVRFAAVQPNRVLKPTQLAELAAVEHPLVALRPAVEPSPASTQKVKHITVLATGRAPLADQHLPDGGLITALVNASLTIADQGDAERSEIDVRWTSNLPTIKVLQSENTIDLSLPWEGADCEQPNDLAHASAMLCDDALYSDPVLQIVIGLFAVSDGGFEFSNDESIFGKTICVPLDRDLSVLNSNGRKWLSDGRISVIRRPTLLDCISLAQQREADAFVASDLEGRYALGQLGLSQLFKMMERPLGTRGVHVIVPKDHAQADELIGAVNRGLKQLKQSDAYSTIVRRHLMKMWDAQASAP